MSSQSSFTRPNASEIIDNVKNKIESCILKYMSFDETVTCLQEKHEISHHLTKIIWEQLQRESPEFFNHYQFKLEMTRQINMFNDLLAKQVAMMIDCGQIDICAQPSPAILNFLCKDPEGTRILDKLASAPEVIPSSLPLTESNGPTVNQSQIPNVHHYQWSTPNGFTDNHLGAPTAAPALTDQWFSPNDISPAASTVSPATTAQWSSSNNPAYIGAPTIAQAANMPQDPSTLEFGGDIGLNGLNSPVLDLPQLLMQPENQLNGQYLPQLQLQNFSQQEQPTLQHGVSNNGIQHRGNNIGVMQFENQLQYLYVQYLPQLQRQQPFLLEELPTLQNGVSNSELKRGGNNNWQQKGGSNIGVMQSENQLQDLYGQYQPQGQLQQPFILEELSTLQNGVSNSELQYEGNNNWLQNGVSYNGLVGVITESAGFNNPSNGDGTLTMAQIQHDLQRV